MTTDDRTETITDRAAIRDSDEPDERTPNEVHVDESGCSCKTGPYRGFQRDPIDAACPKHGEPLRHGDGDVTVCHPDGSTTIIREPDERGDFPYYDLGPVTSEAVGALDLDAIRARALAFPECDRKWHEDGPWWSDGAGESMVSGFDRCAVVVPAPSEHDRLEPVSYVMEHIAGMDPATTLALVAYARRKSTLAADNHARAEAAVAEVRSLRAKVAAVEAEKEAILGQVDQAARLLRLNGKRADAQTVIAQVRRWPEFVDRAALATEEGK